MPRRDSAIFRLCRVILTVALGMAAMKANSSYWTGVMSAVTGCWVYAAFVAAFREAGRRRAFWCGFLAACLVSLGVSFGPRSDRKARADALGWNVDSHKLKISPLSYALAKLMAVVEPDYQGHLDVHEPGSTRYLVGSYRVGPACRGPNLYVFAGTLSSAGYELVAGGSGPRTSIVSASSGYVVMPDYQDCGHMLAALMFGTVAGGIASVFAAIWPTWRPSRHEAREDRGQIGPGAG